MKGAGNDRRIKHIRNCWKTLTPTNYKPKFHNNKSGTDPTICQFYEISIYRARGLKNPAKEIK